MKLGFVCFFGKATSGCKHWANSQAPKNVIKKLPTLISIMFNYRSSDHKVRTVVTIMYNIGWSLLHNLDGCHYSHIRVHICTWFRRWLKFYLRMSFNSVVPYWLLDFRAVWVQWGWKVVVSVYGKAGLELLLCNQGWLWNQALPLQAQECWGFRLWHLSLARCTFFLV